MTIYDKYLEPFRKELDELEYTAKINSEKADKWYGRSEKIKMRWFVLPTILFVIFFWFLFDILHFSNDFLEGATMDIWAGMVVLCALVFAYKKAFLESKGVKYGARALSAEKKIERIRDLQTASEVMGVPRSKLFDNYVP